MCELLYIRITGAVLSTMHKLNDSFIFWFYLDYNIEYFEVSTKEISSLLKLSCYAKINMIIPGYTAM